MFTITGNEEKKWTIINAYRPVMNYTNTGSVGSVLKQVYELEGLHNHVTIQHGGHFAHSIVAQVLIT